MKRISTGSVVIGAPAKVNLFLEVLSRREDGYHDINSLFQAVSLFDRLRIRRLPAESGVRLSLDGPDSVPTDERNLVCRAYNLMRDRFDLQDGLEVDLEKNIPVAAGLAGGSADAAATILACSVLFDLQLEYTDMALLGQEIGSDVPFFFSRGQALVTGRGEQITATNFPTDYWLVLVTPNLHISTAESYARLRTGLTKSRVPFTLEGCRTSEE
ncbi:MAG: 4-(cytidine 5'-diphospho)-2-C-methyl-D-erythritol kinase, partial [candidate division Zixibacteria bacterium]|nr:4-(cytidine 5'-diphospho)-2-C-methyl-D-erythritol kinase [candidate division Zixibacteria bacterium]